MISGKFEECDCSKCRYCTLVCADTHIRYWNSYYCEYWKDYMGSKDCICNAFEQEEEDL